MTGEDVQTLSLELLALMEAVGELTRAVAALTRRVEALEGRVTVTETPAPRFEEVTYA